MKRYLLIYMDGQDENLLEVFHDPDWDPQAVALQPEDFGLPEDVDLMFLIEAGDIAGDRPLVYRIQMDAATEMPIEFDTTPTEESAA